MIMFLPVQGLDILHLFFTCLEFCLRYVHAVATLCIPVNRKANYYSNMDEVMECDCQECN